MKKLVFASLFIGIYLLLKESGIVEFLDLSYIQTQKELIISLSKEYQLLFILAFILTYIAIVSFQIPGATILTLLAGAIFGPFFGTLWVNIGASLGALLAFLVARFLLQETINKKLGKKLQEFNKGIKENGFNYILFLRLVPLFPFFLINLLAGLTLIKVKDYYLATMIGIVPGSFVYCNVGAALWQIGSLKDIVSGQTLLAFSLLGLLSLVPIIYKKYSGGKK
jgi:uncharacterized membrane protein YdjX (TVP38/TMEM64 family)